MKGSVFSITGAFCSSNVFQRRNPKLYGELNHKGSHNETWQTKEHIRMLNIRSVKSNTNHHWSRYHQPTEPIVSLLITSGVSCVVIEIQTTITIYYNDPMRNHWTRSWWNLQRAEEWDKEIVLNLISTSGLTPPFADHWCSSSFESQACIRALQLYRQNKGCYESWDLLLGTEEQVIFSKNVPKNLPVTHCSKKFLSTWSISGVFGL